MLFLAFTRTTRSCLLSRVCESGSADKRNGVNESHFSRVVTRLLLAPHASRWHWWIRLLRRIRVHPAHGSCRPLIFLLIRLCILGLLIQFSFYIKFSCVASKISASLQWTLTARLQMSLTLDIVCKNFNAQVKSRISNMNERSRRQNSKGFKRDLSGRLLQMTH